MTDFCDIERYSRTLIIDEIGFDGQQKFSDAKILIIGCGGLGIPVAQNLVAMGFGHITICDFDKIELHNLQRQHIFKEEDIDKYKAEVLSEELKKRNSSVFINYDIVKVDDIYLNENVIENEMPKFDYIVDATDDIENRLLVNDFCVKNNIPLIIGSIEKFALNVFFVNGFGACYRCFFDAIGGKNLKSGCDKVGVYPPIVSVCGVFMVDFIVKSILDMDMKHNFMSLDLLNITSNSIKIKKNVLCNTCKRN